MVSLRRVICIFAPLILLLAGTGRAWADESAELVFGPAEWGSAAGWTLLEGSSGQAKTASLTTQPKGELLINGAIARPLKLAALDRTTLDVSFRFYVPDACPDWTSVSAAFYGGGSNRTYVMVVLKLPKGGSALRLEGGTSVPVTLKPATWHTLSLKITDGTLVASVWPEGSGNPAPQLTTDAPGQPVEQFGVRTFAAAVAVADLKLSATPHTPPPLDRSLFPEPVFDAKPGYVDLYWKACELARMHVLDQPGMPQSPYLDEAFSPKTIWIWDTCFMALFSRYTSKALPGIESLTNFYAPIHDGAPTRLADGRTDVKVQHPDNPPLFAWVEWEHFRITGDHDRVRWLLHEKQYLQKHFDWFNTLERGGTFPWSRIAVRLKPGELGFQWRGISSGMDNSPRFKADVYAVDALAQQGLSALCIARLARAINDNALADEYQLKYEQISRRVNAHYWDDADGFYYDLLPDGKTFQKVMTPASFWPVLAGMTSPDRVARMAERVRHAKELGGPVPWVSVSRSDPDFDDNTGRYWRGSIWLPTAYLGVRALADNGQRDLADQTAEAVVEHMYRTFVDYAPHTIWECYNPNRPEPAMDAANKHLVRPDFCGWSALGPISMLIENLIGVHTIDAAQRRVEWNIHHPGRLGVRRLRFADVTADLIADGQGHVDVQADRPFTLVINAKAVEISSGIRRIDLNGM